MSGLIQIGKRRSLNAETERRAHLRSEAALKTGAALYVALGLLLLASVVAAVLSDMSAVEVSSAVTLGIAGALGVALGRDLFRLRPRAKWPALFCFGIAALGSGVALGSAFGRYPRSLLILCGGSLILHLYLIATVLRPPGRRVLSSAYAEILAASQSVRAPVSLPVGLIAGLTILSAMVLR